MVGQCVFVVKQWQYLAIKHDPFGAVVSDLTYHYSARSVICSSVGIEE